MTCMHVLNYFHSPYRTFPLFYLYRCGLRGGYLELVGFSNAVKLQFRDMMSPSNSGSTIGQVLFQVS